MQVLPARLERGFYPVLTNLAANSSEQGRPQLRTALIAVRAAALGPVSGLHAAALRVFFDGS
jgi:hypothetical protein